MATALVGVVLMVLPSLAAGPPPTRISGLHAIGGHEKDLSRVPSAAEPDATGEPLGRATWGIAAGAMLASGVTGGLAWWIVHRQHRSLRQAADETRACLEQSRRQLRQAERLASAGKLAAGVAHEIRNPLTAIRIWLFSIRKAVCPDAELDRKFDIVSGELARLESLVENFLEFSKPAAPSLCELSVSTVIDRTLELACYQVRQKRIEVVREEPPELPRVRSDPRQLQQVLLNLLVNAVEAMPDGGEIRFRATLEKGESNGSMVVVHVQDSGPGIPDAARPWIFEPFYTTKGTGTGLGLSIAAEIMAGLGGRLVLESSTPAGTSFALWAPTVAVENGEQDPCR